MMTTAAATPTQVKGGAFLIEDRSPNEIFTAEDLNEEHLAIARTVEQFWTNEVEPHLEAIRQRPSWDSPRYRSPRNSAAWKWTCRL
jgi:hypothetical protein